MGFRTAGVVDGVENRGNFFTGIAIVTVIILLLIAMGIVF